MSATTSLPVSTEPEGPAPSLPVAMLLSAMAGGMGWGIRGQYGHETGAMIAGLLVALVLVRLFAPRAAALGVARAVAWATVAIGFGGSETYGQTVGLTHDPALVGNHAALAWGMLGLGIKGAVWIGFFGAFLGMGLSGVRYRAVELLVLMLALIGLLLLGVQLLNEPYDPARRLLPRYYFSATWDWQPDAVNLRPRLERWGGLLFAWAGLTAYVGLVRRDGLARNLALWAFLGGAIGFPLGQCLQAFHAWNRELFQTGVLARADAVINWWNFMETTFGAVFGATVALGLWLNRRRIAVADDPKSVTLATPAEWGLVAVHVATLIVWGFVRWPAFGDIADLALTMGVIPIVGIAAGRLWPYLLALPITALPIAAKTFRQLGVEEAGMDPTLAALVYVGLPLATTTAVAVTYARRSSTDADGSAYTSTALLVATWLFFGLNYAFFHFPWPWDAWTMRTPNAIVFTVCAVGLTWLATRGPERANGER